jgi:hypothetical protein
MIDVKQAVQIAQKKAVQILDQKALYLEEFESQVYNGREVWSITLSLPPVAREGPLAQLSSMRPLRYKRFLIDKETGELSAIKLREVVPKGNTPARFGGDNLSIE